MHILFLHQNFPAQFGQIAMHLARTGGYRCTCVSEKEIADSPEIQHVRFESNGGATRDTHHCSRTFENQTWRSHAAFEALRARPDIQPDLIVAHSGFVSSLFLRELYGDVPHIGYFEFFYHAHDSDIDFRRDLPLPPTKDLLRVRRATPNCCWTCTTATPVIRPRSSSVRDSPAEYRSKISAIFDGIDTDFWRRDPSTSREFGGVDDSRGSPRGDLCEPRISRRCEDSTSFCKWQIESVGSETTSP